MSDDKSKGYAAHYGLLVDTCCKKRIILSKVVVVKLVRNGLELTYLVGTHDSDAS